MWDFARPEASEQRFRAAYQRAFDAAKAGGLDGLAVDALHMMAFVDTAPADQLRWGREALAVILASAQPAASVYEELELLYKARRDGDRAGQYARLRAGLVK